MPHLPADVRELTEKLRDGTPLDEVLRDLDIYVRYCCDCPEVYAPVFVPALAAALDKADLEDADTDNGPHAQLTPIFKRLGPTVVRLARNRHAVVRQAVAAAVAEMGPAGGSAADDMARLLADPDPGVRAQACKALATVRPTRASAQLLAKCLNDRSEEVAVQAVLGLGMIGPGSVEVVPQLMQFLDPEAYRRSALCYQTLRALTNLPGDPSLLERLKPLLKRDWEKLCPDSLLVSLELGALAVLLGQLGSSARECVPELGQLLQLDDQVISPGNKIDIACALLRIDADNALALKSLEQVATHPEHRLYLIRNLEDIPLAVQVRLRRLIENLADDPKKAVRTAAQELLDRINRR
jgi:hypothetical protein